MNALALGGIATATGVGAAALGYATARGIPPEAPADDARISGEEFGEALALTGVAALIGSVGATFGPVGAAAGPALFAGATLGYQFGTASAS